MMRYDIMNGQVPELNAVYHRDKDGGGGKNNGSVRTSSDEDNESMEDGYMNLQMARHGHIDQCDVRDDEIVIKEGDGEYGGQNFEDALMTHNKSLEH